MVLELIDTVPAGGLDVNDYAIDDAIDMAKYVFDGDFLLSIGDGVTGFLNEQEGEFFKDVSIQKLEEYMWLKWLSIPRTVNIVIKLTTAASPNIATTDSPFGFSFLKSIFDMCTYCFCEFIDGGLGGLVATPKQSIDIFN